MFVHTNKTKNKCLRAIDECLHIVIGMHIGICIQLIGSELYPARARLFALYNSHPYVFSLIRAMYFLVCNMVEKPYVDAKSYYDLLIFEISWKLIDHGLI